jgi:hypothetical protein
MLWKICIKRLWIIPVREWFWVDIARKITFLAWAGWLWYEFKNTEIFNDSVLEIFDEVYDTLNELRWWNVSKVPLFVWFPEKTPNDREYFEKRITWFVWNFLWVYKEWKKMDNWIIVPEWLFDINQFWADPITQFQDLWLFNKVLDDQKTKLSDKHAELKTLEFVYQEDVLERLQIYMTNLLYSKSSIKQWFHAELIFLLDYFWLEKVDTNKIIFKEIQAFVSKYLWERWEYIVLWKILKSSTDLLRLFALLTNTDISLAGKIKFPKFNREQRRFILWEIERFYDVNEDFYKYGDLWKKLWEYLHPWEYKKSYPKAFLYFDNLRNWKIITLNSQIQKAVELKNIDKLLWLLSWKAWLFARKLHEILEISWKNYSKVLVDFENIWNQIQLKNLLIMKSYFETIEESEYRTVINKLWKIKILKNNKNRLFLWVDKKVVLLIEKIIVSKLEKESKLLEKNNKENGIKSVYIDNSLKNIMIPLSSRKALDWYYTCGRWSRFDIDMTKTIRLFAYWKEKISRTDLDLSVIFFNKNFETVWHVSYTNLAEKWIVHSWDIQSAPYWAVEYIDIDLKYLLSKNSIKETLKSMFFADDRDKIKDISYIAVQIYKFVWDDFDDIDCFAWWQIRDNVDSDYKSFDEKTVANKFDLYGRWSYFMPLIIDIENKNIVYTDLSIDARNNLNNVEWSLDTVSLVTSQVLWFTKSKPNIYDLALYHAKWKNLEIVSEKDNADIVFDIFDWNYNIINAEKILSELL